jgi:DNA polymerase-3 subunit delta
MYFDEFLNRLKTDMPLLALFFGDSESVLSEGAQAIKDKFRRKWPEGSLRVFDGAFQDLGEIIAAAQTDSLFSPSQLLVVQHAEKILGGRSEASLQQLGEYCSNANSNSTLVFLAPGLRKSAKAVSAVERMGWAVQCYDIPEWKLEGWVKQKAKAQGMDVSDEAVRLLIQKVGPDIAYLQPALEQMAVFVHPHKSVSDAIVRDLPVPGIESEIFSLLDAIGLRQPENALRVMARMSEGIETGTLMMAYGRIRELLMIALERVKGIGQAAVAEKLGLNSFRLKNLWEQSARYTATELKQALRDLIHLQAGVVTGRIGRCVLPVLFETWILKWGRKRQPTAHW